VPEIDGTPGVHLTLAEDELRLRANFHTERDIVNDCGGFYVCARLGVDSEYAE